MRVCHRTHQGLVRASNQDNWLAQAPLYGVADGMGGHKGGETASRVALQVFQNAIGRKTPDESLSGMGTTMSMIWQDDTRLLIAHVGDSRIYRLREGKLRQMTDDHSFVAELVRNNIITPEMAKNHPQRNIITRAVGVDPYVEVDLLEEESEPGDIWLICSDGLHGMVEDEEIQTVLSTMELEEAAERLMSRALENGGHDNITFVLLSHTEVTDK